MFEWETLFPVTGPLPVTWQTLDIDLAPIFNCIEQIGNSLPTVGIRHQNLDS